MKQSSTNVNVTLIHGLIILLSLLFCFSGILSIAVDDSGLNGPNDSSNSDLSGHPQLQPKPKLDEKIKGNKLPIGLHYDLDIAVKEGDNLTPTPIKGIDDSTYTENTTLRQLLESNKGNKVISKYYNKDGKLSSEYDIPDLDKKLGDLVDKDGKITIRSEKKTYKLSVNIGSQPVEISGITGLTDKTTLRSLLANTKNKEAIKSAFKSAGYTLSDDDKYLYKDGNKTGYYLKLDEKIKGNQLPIGLHYDLDIAVKEWDNLTPTPLTV